MVNEHMTDQEINESVAEKLGWKDSDYPVKGWYRRTVNGKEEYTNAFDEHYDYCHSIEAAWEIVEQMGDRIVIERRERRPGESIAWRVTIGPETQAFADTAPMAICLAFLKLEQK